MSQPVVMRSMRLVELFSDEELGQAELCLNIEELRTIVIEPHIEAINRRSGQENCPQFLAYLLGAVLMSQGWPHQRAGQS
jgi:hypothetical protein